MSPREPETTFAFEVVCAAVCARPATLAVVTAMFGESTTALPSTVPSPATSSAASPTRQSSGATGSGLPATSPTFCITPPLHHGPYLFLNPVPLLTNHARRAVVPGVPL